MHFRLHKVPGAHYESASLRKFIHGRTETIRSCSVESIKFAQTMLDNSTSVNEKATALRTAIKAHKDYTMLVRPRYPFPRYFAHLIYYQALNGEGVDRHLLGLRLIAAENKIELPDLFKDAAYSRSAHMRLSTSQVNLQRK
jgi:carnitine O-acetyltransferase